MTYYGTYQYVIMSSESSKKRKIYTLKTGKPAGSNRSRVSNRSRESDGIVQMQAGGFY